MSRLLFVVLVFFQSLVCYAGNNKADSLLVLLPKTNNDQIKVELLLEIANEYYVKMNDQAGVYADKAMKLSKNIKYGEGIAGAIVIKANLVKDIGDYSKASTLFKSALSHCTSQKGKHCGKALLGLAFISRNESRYDEATAYYKQAEKVFVSLKEKRYLAITYDGLGVVLDIKGELPAALDYYLKSLALCEELKLNRNISASLMNIGMLFMTQKNYESAEEYLLRAYKIISAENFLPGMAGALNNLGALYYTKNMVDSALACFEYGYKIYQKMGNDYQLATSFHNIGSIHYERKDYKKALEFYYRSLELDEKMKDLESVARTNINIATCYGSMGNLGKAIEMGLKSRDIAEKINSRSQVVAAYKHLAEFYAKSNDYKKAREFHGKHLIYKDSLLNETNSKDLALLKTRFDTEKKEKAIELLKREKDVQSLEIKKNTLLTYAYSGGAALFLLTCIAIGRSYRTKKRSNVLLKERNSEIDSHKNIIEEKNRHITDSITYAKTIQESVFPSHERVREVLPQSFIMFQPRDIVSGDFYWVEKVDSHLFFTVADCTGHGVPGAFMSLLGLNALNKAVNEDKLSSPGEILFSLNLSIMQALPKREGVEVKDGMDINMCCFDENSGVLKYAGAFNPLWIISSQPSLTVNNTMVTAIMEKSGKYLFEIKSDKQMLGSVDDANAYKTNCIEVNDGDWVYLFTDGFADQFGGPKGKKFKYKPLQELLLLNSTSSAQLQKESLVRTMDEWKTGHEQIDDICIMGVQIKKS